MSQKRNVAWVTPTPVAVTHIFLSAVYGAVWLSWAPVGPGSILNGFLNPDGSQGLFIRVLKPLAYFTLYRAVTSELTSVKVDGADVTAYKPSQDVTGNPLLLLGGVAFAFAALGELSQGNPPRFSYTYEFWNPKYLVNGAPAVPGPYY